MKEISPNNPLEKGQVERVTKTYKGYTPPCRYEGLTLILADIIDTALLGRECYMTFGLSKSKDLIMMTVTNNGAKLYASGTSLEELSDNAKLLL